MPSHRTPSSAHRGKHAQPHEKPSQLELPAEPETEDDVPEITARPMRVAERQANEPDADEGLSIDPEEMGRQFLRGATEQGESFHGRVAELSITGPAPSDTATSSASGRATLWDVTVDRASSSGAARKRRRRQA